MRSIKFISALLAAAGVSAVVSTAQAQLATLTDGNASAQFDPGTSAGNFNWFVNNNDYLAQQWFWIRATGDTSERPISSLNKTFQNSTNTNADPGLDTLNLHYVDSLTAARYSVDTTFTLRGGPGTQISSDIAETLIIHNSSADPLTFSFIQYVDFDLSSADTAQILFGRIAQQFGNGLTVTEEALTVPGPTQYAVGFFPTILNSLNDGAITNLGTISGPLGPGDMTWAFQWDFTLASGQDFLISKDKKLTPAPGAAFLLGLGGLVASRRRRTA